jgi:putative ABC transport system substrate-binding protein
MHRRAFVTLLSGAAAAWPLRVRAQQGMPVIGVLMPGVLNRTAHFVEAFRQGLRATGYSEGQNVTIEVRFAEGRYETLPALASDLVKRRVSAIVAGPRAEWAAKEVSASTPVIFMTGVDPVGSGLVASLNQPGANVTGATLLSYELEAKRIGLLRELVPRTKLIAVLVDSTVPAEASLISQVQAIGRSVDVSIQVVRAGSERDFEGAFAAIANEGANSLLVSSSVSFVSLRDRLVAVATKYRIPAIYGARELAEAGGLMSYSANAIEAWKQVGVYTGRVLKGAKPADLPVVLPTLFEFVVNLKTAKAMGLDLPSTLLARADEVIE